MRQSLPRPRKHDRQPAELIIKSPNTVWKRQAIGAILRKQIRAPEKERPRSGPTGEQARRTRSKGDITCPDHETGRPAMYLRGPRRGAESISIDDVGVVTDFRTPNHRRGALHRRWVSHHRLSARQTPSYLCSSQISLVLSRAIWCTPLRDQHLRSHARDAALPISWHRALGAPPLTESPAGDTRACRPGPRAKRAPGAGGRATAGT